MDAVPDTCRICSAPAEAEQPLFYPCKCSGTIRYIHQDWYAFLALCDVQLSRFSSSLTTWLAHSKKKTCDVCKHPYSFTKGPPAIPSNFLMLIHAHSLLVYATDMPTRLPPVLLLRRVAQQSFFAMLFAMRAVVVAIIWLAVLPWATVMTWRTYFSMGDSTCVSTRSLENGALTHHSLVPGGLVIVLAHRTRLKNSARSTWLSMRSRRAFLLRIHSLLELPLIPFGSRYHPIFLQGRSSRPSWFLRSWPSSSFGSGYPRTPGLACLRMRTPNPSQRRCYRHRRRRRRFSLPLHLRPRTQTSTIGSHWLNGRWTL